MGGCGSVEYINGSQQFMGMAAHDMLRRVQVRYHQSSGLKIWVVAMRPAVLLLLIAIGALAQNARAFQLFDHRRGEIGQLHPFQEQRLPRPTLPRKKDYNFHGHERHLHPSGGRRQGKYQLRVEMPAFAPEHAGNCPR